LEDDDLFIKEKLKYVYDTFQKNKSIVYVNNARRYIDKSGKYLNKGPWKFERREKDIIIKNSDKRLINLLKIQQYNNPFFNQSSIAIKTSILKRFLDDLKNIKFAPDLFYYFISLLSGDLLISSKELTLYRVHESTSNSIKDYVHFKAVNCKFFDDEKYIANIVLKRNSIKIKIKRGLKKYAYIRLKDAEITYLFYAGNYRKRVLLDYLEIFPFIIRAFPNIAIRRGLQVAFYIVAPEKFRRFNYERTKKYIESIVPKNKSIN
jgi:hypothetical protein